MVNTMFDQTFVMMERRHQAVMRVAFGDVDPVVAIAEVEWQ